MEQRALKIISYLKTSGGQNSNLYLNAVHFSIPVLIRHLSQLKTVAFLALVSYTQCSIVVVLKSALDLLLSI